MFLWVLWTILANWIWEGHGNPWTFQVGETERWQPWPLIGIWKERGSLVKTESLTCRICAHFQQIQNWVKLPDTHSESAEYCLMWKNHTSCIRNIFCSRQESVLFKIPSRLRRELRMLAREPNWGHYKYNSAPVEGLSVWLISTLDLAIIRMFFDKSVSSKSRLVRPRLLLTAVERTMY